MNLNSSTYELWLYYNIISKIFLNLKRMHSDLLREQNKVWKQHINSLIISFHFSQENKKI